MADDLQPTWLRVPRWGGHHG